MPVLVLVCVVIATLALVATAATVMVIMIRLGQTTARMASAAQVSMAQVERVAQEAQELLASMRETMSPTQRVVERLQRLGDRAADLSTVVLDEIEAPVFTAVAVARGVKAGGAQLLHLLTRRLAQRHDTNNGDQDHDGQYPG